MIITIDGPAGSGKSTVALLLADKLNATYLDTGAMYRAITLAALADLKVLDSPSGLIKLADQCRIRFARQAEGNRVLLDGRDVTDDIRSEQVTSQAHRIARIPEIRAILVKQQQQIGRESEVLVTEGRDQGTVVFPQAQFKFYLDARPEVRAQRRFQQQKSKNPSLTLQEVLDAQNQRDANDRNREVGALKPAVDSITIDTSEMNIEQVVQRLYELVRQGKDIPNGCENTWHPQP